MTGWIAFALLVAYIAGILTAIKLGQRHLKKKKMNNNYRMN